MGADLNLAEGPDDVSRCAFMMDYQEWLSIKDRVERTEALSFYLSKWHLSDRIQFAQTNRQCERYLERSNPTTIPIADEKPRDFETDKPGFGLNWREAVSLLKPVQDLLHRAGGNQDEANIDFSHVDKPICLVGLGDLHMLSWGTDYDSLVQITDEILSLEGVYIAALGDFLQMSINLRSVLEVSDNALPPAAQEMFLESWLEEIYPKVAFATWDNHSVIRGEKQAGTSAYSTIFKRRCVYFNGIGHVNLTVGSQTYSIAASHKFRGSSYLNPTHSQSRYIRMEAPDKDIVMSADSHIPAVAQYAEGQGWHTVMNSGTLQTNSGYAKRHFSLKTSSEMPCVVLFPNEKRHVPFRSLADYLAIRDM